MSVVRVFAQHTVCSAVECASATASGGRYDTAEWCCSSCVELGFRSCRWMATGATLGGQTSAPAVYGERTTALATQGGAQKYASAEWHSAGSTRRRDGNGRLALVGDRGAIGGVFSAGLHSLTPITSLSGWKEAVSVRGGRWQILECDEQDEADGQSEDAPVVAAGSSVSGVRKDGTRTQGSQRERRARAHHGKMRSSKTPVKSVGDGRGHCHAVGRTMMGRTGKRRRQQRRRTTIAAARSVQVSVEERTLSFCCWNVNGLTTTEKSSAFADELLGGASSYDVVGLTETHLSRAGMWEMDVHHRAAYHFFSCAREGEERRVDGRGSGGLLLAVRKRPGLKAVRKQTHEYGDIMWVQIDWGRWTWYVGLVYMPGAGSHRDGADSMQQIVLTCINCKATCSCYVKIERRNWWSWAISTPASGVRGRLSWSPTLTCRARAAARQWGTTP